MNFGARRIGMAVSFALVTACFGAGAEEAFTNGCGMRMIPVPAGEFTMGETNEVPASTGTVSGPYGNEDETPAHRVRITKPFYVSETEVTAEQFAKFRAGYTGPEPFPSFAAGISWNEANAFCRWLSEQEGKPYRLPTEAEWEYACRAGTQGLFWSGGDMPESDTNPFGLKNMHGEVAEWCLDWYGLYPDTDQADPVGPAAGDARVVRGGGIEVHPIDEAKLEGLSPDAFQELTQGFYGVPYGQFPPFYRRAANRASLVPDAPPSGANAPLQHFIGFRVVQAPMPETAPLPYEPPLPMSGVKQTKASPERGPAPDKPYMKVRPMLPIPPENAPDAAMPALGIHPSVKGHIHSGALTVCPNGDLLMVSFSSTRGTSEASSNTTKVCTRLRYGADEWDMPDLFLDLADLNDQSALLWTDGDTVWFFGGGRYFGPGRQPLGNVPFRFRKSTDNGATWSELKVPVINGPVSDFTAQPINSAFRGPDGTIYFGMDGAGASSFLWASSDDGKTWENRMGQTRGRHTTFALLKDQRILAMGGKSSDIEGHMPKCYSSDWGKTWSEGVKTPFSALGTNQRPTIIRLKSGRLFFAGDFQHFSAMPAPDIKERGAYVALSEDEGETWRIKKLDLATPHERHREKTDVWEPKDGPEHRYPTIGYSVAAQAPNGVIHLMSSMNHPSLHFAMNEAWILSDEQGEVNHERPAEVSEAAEPLVVGPDGQQWRHGVETWQYPDGKKQYEVTYDRGKKVGEETLWRPDGHRKWMWDRRPDGTSTWTHFWPNGQKKIESHWVGIRADGPATHWDRDGKVIAEHLFKNGDFVD